VDIPKTDGGTRTLKIRVLADRLVAVALKEALEPILELQFAHGSYGFRARRNVPQMLVAIEQAVEAGYCYLAQDDIQQAFDNVPIATAMGLLREHIEEAAYLDLVEKVLRGGDDSHLIGIDQGSALSPLILNLVLHHVHDTHFEAEGGQHAVTHNRIIWLRYADNLVYLSQLQTEGREALQCSQELISSQEFQLKDRDQGDERIIDLREQSTELLGFTLYMNQDQLSIGLGSDAWENLREKLVRAHEDENPRSLAKGIVNGWITAYGPAFGHSVESKAVSLDETLSELGFTFLMKLTDLQKRLNRAWNRYRGLKVRLYRENSSSCVTPYSYDNNSNSETATAPRIPLDRAV